MSKLIKLIEREELNRPNVQAEIEIVSGSNRWFSAMHAWVGSFLRPDRSQSLPMFDVLSNDEGPTAETIWVKDHETPKVLATRTMETYRANPDERVDPPQIHRIQCLNVDEVLARSLPKAIGQES
jgi:hypothetical protein